MSASWSVAYGDQDLWLDHAGHLSSDPQAAIRWELRADAEKQAAYRGEPHCVVPAPAPSEVATVGDDAPDDGEFERGWAAGFACGRGEQKGESPASPDDRARVEQALAENEKRIAEARAACASPTERRSRDLLAGIAEGRRLLAADIRRSLNPVRER